jgi:ABC-type Mn2+/Zn2+ transport system ATPase subunit
VERDERAGREAEAQAGAIEREQELVQRYRSQRKHTKMHEHEARLERLDRIEAPRAGPRMALSSRMLLAGPSARSAEVVVRATDLVIGYPPGIVVARAPLLEARRGERIGIVGPNGAGKTTLLRTIAGELPLLDGRLVLGSGVGIGYLAQLRDAALPGETVLEAVLAEVPLPPGEARGYLARFLFRGDDVFKEVRALSGGERSRLELALLGVLPANLLLLDEPTNHLDIPAREALESFLRETPSTILIVSHDRRFLDTVCETLWVVDDRAAVPFAGGYRAWRAAVAEGWTVETALAAQVDRARGLGRGVGGGLGGPAPRLPAAIGAAVPVPGNGRPSGTSSGRVIGRSPGRQPRLSKDLYRRQKAVIEADLTRLGLRKNHLELALGDSAVGSNFVELRRITSELADVDQALSAAEEAWLLLEERAP